MEADNRPLLLYLDIVLRRRWFIILPLFLSLVVAPYLALTIPPVYQSETTILVEPQQVPEAYVESTVTGSVQDRLNIISQQILSRTGLEKVIQQFDLYPERRQEAPMEDVINIMRQNIEVEVISGTRSSGRDSAAAAFKLGFYHRNPETAQIVTRKLASMYIEENLRIREILARGTRMFLDKQLLGMETQLKSREEALREFKQNSMGELPEQLESNLRSLEQLQIQKGSVQESLRNTESDLILLEQQLVDTPRLLTGGASGRDNMIAQLEQKKQTLTTLSTRYTDRYPDVIRLKKEIRKIERKLSNPTGAEEPESGDSQPLSPVYTRLKNQVDEYQLDIQSYKREIGQISSKMKKLQQRVDNVPKREQELISLLRDYDSIKQSYDSLMERKLNAEIAESLETRQKSEQFRILDPANFPQRPAKPDRLKILVIGLFTGLGIGVGLALLLEHLDRSYRKVEEINATLDIPVLCVIPTLTTTVKLKQTRLKLWALAYASLALIVLSMVVVVLFLEEIKSTLSGLLH